MDYLLFPKKTPEYRQGRSHTDFLCSLKQYWPEKKSFIKHFLNTIEEGFILQHEQEENLSEILLRPHRKATSIIDLNFPKI